MMATSRSAESAARSGQCYGTQTLFDLATHRSIPMNFGRGCRCFATPHVKKHSAKGAICYSLFARIASIDQRGSLHPHINVSVVKE